MNLVLGTTIGKKYRIAQDCLNKLKSLDLALDADTDASLRLSLLNSQTYQRQILEVLATARSETQDDILSAVIRILVKMTTPLDSVSGLTAPVSDQLTASYSQYLSKLKEEFHEPRYTWPVLKLLKLFTSGDDQAEHGAAILDSLNLIGNLLSISEYQCGSTAAAVIANLQRPNRKYGFIWNVLYQNLDTVLISLIRSHRWTKPVMRILLLLYHGVENGKLVHLITEWIATATVTSSSDYTYPESSNTSGPKSRSSEAAGVTETGSLTSASDSQHKDEDSQDEPHSPSPKESASGGAAGETTVVVDTGPDQPSSRQKRGSSCLMMEAQMMVEAGEDAEAALAATTTTTNIHTEEPPCKRLKVDSKDRKKRLTKKERDQLYKDYGFTSGCCTDMSSSGSDNCDKEEPWRVRVSDLSDHGYVSYLTQNDKKKMRKSAVGQSVPPKEEELRERRRQLLEKKMRGKARARTLMYHVATEADVLEILTDFTIDFLLKGYSILQSDIRQIIANHRRSDAALIKYKASLLLSTTCSQPGHAAGPDPSEL